MTTVTSLAAAANMGVPHTEALMARKAQVFIHHAIDRYLGTLARESKSPETLRKYRQVLDPFGDRVRDKLPAEITTDDVNAYIDQWATKSPATLALYVTVMRRFFAWCCDENIVTVSPAEHLKRPRRQRPEDLDVVTISSADLDKLFRACVDWQERLCIGVLAYMGVRRNAAANVRRRDVDLDTGMMRFREKGRKAIAKPIPDDLLALLRHADELGQWLHGDEFLIPYRKPWLAKHRQHRNGKLVYEWLQRVADRAGVRVHPHAIRAAYAVKFDAAHPGHLRALKELLGHVRIETTMTYLRRSDRAEAMETVRDLSWGSPFASVLPPSVVMPRTGFEPVFQPDTASDAVEAVRRDASLPDELLGLARDQAKAGESSDRVERASKADVDG